MIYTEGYEGSGGIPWIVKEKNGVVDSIFFRDIFFDFIKPDIWKSDVKEFIRKVNSTLEPIEDTISGPRLKVVFRGGFVAIVDIEINESTTTYKNNAKIVLESKLCARQLALFLYETLDTI